MLGLQAMIKMFVDFLEEEKEFIEGEDETDYFFRKVKLMEWILEEASRDIHKIADAFEDLGINEVYKA